MKLSLLLLALVAGTVLLKPGKADAKTYHKIVYGCKGNVCGSKIVGGNAP